MTFGITTAPIYASYLYYGRFTGHHITFEDGKFLGLNYFVTDQFLIGDITVDDAIIGGSKLYNFEEIDGSSYAVEVGTVSYTKVPEPLSLSGIAIAGILGLWLKRQKKASPVAG